AIAWEHYRARFDHALGVESEGFLEDGAFCLVPPRKAAKSCGEFMTFLPVVTRAEYCGDHRIHVTFNDGQSGTIDFSPAIEGPIFEPLKDTEYFQRFFIDGGTVTWPNGA